MAEEAKGFTMKTKCLSVIAALTLLGMSQASANTVYFVHDGFTEGFLPGFGEFVDGTITTNGKLGVLSGADILAWNLLVSFGASPIPPVTLTESNSIVSFQGVSFPDPINPIPANPDPSNLTATTAGLFWDWSLHGAFLSFILVQGNLTVSINYDSPHNGNGRFYILEKDCVDCGVRPAAQERSGIQEIGAATPLPAALPLFATGLGALGLIGWKRERRSSLVGSKWGHS